VTPQDIVRHLKEGKVPWGESILDKILEQATVEDVLAAFTLPTAVDVSMSRPWLTGLG
jgi:hypothetical protein